MPGFNQKGPMGQGSMTGRKRGRCANRNATQMNMPNTHESAGKKLREQADSFFTQCFGLESSGISADNKKDVIHTLRGGLGLGYGMGGSGRHMRRHNH